MTIILYNNIHIMLKNIKNQIPFRLISVILQYSKTVKKTKQNKTKKTVKALAAKFPNGHREITVNNCITELHTRTVKKHE